jgi:hypothetical protein
VANTIFCDDNIEVQVGQWQQISIDVFDRLQVLFTAKSLTTSFVPKTDLPGGDYSVTSVTYDGTLSVCVDGDCVDVWHRLHCHMRRLPFACLCPLLVLCMADPLQCKNACDLTTACAAWSYVNVTATAARTCYLKSSAPNKASCSASLVCFSGIKGEPWQLKVQVGSYAKGVVGATDVYVDNIVYASVTTLPSSCPSIQLVSQLVSRKVRPAAIIRWYGMPCLVP